MTQYSFALHNKRNILPNITFEKSNEKHVSAFLRPKEQTTKISQFYFKLPNNPNMYFPMLLRTRKERKLLRTRKKRNMSKISSYSRLLEKMQYYSVLQGNQTFKVTLCLKPGGHTFEIWLNLLCLRCVWALTLVAILCKLPHIERMSCHATSNWCRALSTTTTPLNELWCQSSKLLSCHVDGTDF